MLLALSLALATCPSPPDGIVPTDDPELATALDAADRAAWALRDVETLLFARRAWNARLGRLRAAGEATAHDDVDARLAEAVAQVVATTATGDGALVAAGDTVAGIAMPDLLGLELLPVDEALARLAVEAEALMAARDARVVGSMDPCGALQAIDPGPAAATGPWGPFVEAVSEAHLARQVAQALAQADHGAATFERIVTRMRQLAEFSADERLDDGERAFIQERYVQLSSAQEQISVRPHWHGHPLHQGVDTDIALPDLTVWMLGIDTGSLDLSTSGGASAALVGLDVAREVLEAAREGFADNVSALPLAPPEVPAVTVDGAAGALSCGAVADAVAAVSDADAALADWDATAHDHERLLVELQAGQLRWSSDARPMDPSVPDPRDAVATLGTGADADSIGVNDLHGTRSLTLPGLREDFPVDARGFPDLPALLDAREQLAADRWRVHVDRQLLRLDILALTREAALCAEPIPALSFVPPPSDPAERAIDIALRRNRVDGRALVAETLAALADSIDAVQSLRDIVVQALETQTPLSDYEPDLLALRDDLALAAATEWHGRPLDGSSTFVLVDRDGVDTVTLFLPDLDPAGLGVDPEVWLSEGTSGEGVLPALDVGLDLLHQHASRVEAVEEHLRVEKHLAAGP